MPEASHATLEVGGATLEVRTLEGDEAISTLFTYRLSCRARLPLPSPRAVIGAAAALTLVDPEGQARIVRGFVASARGRAYDDQEGHVDFVLRPGVFDLTLGRASRSFQSSTLRQILEVVLGPHAGSTRFAFTSGAPIPYRVERDESDWQFIERTLADAGLVYWFDHARGSSLVIADGLTAAEPLEGRDIPVIVRAAAGEVSEAIVELGSANVASFTSHVARGFRWEKPALDVSSSAGGGAHESYEHVLELTGLRSVGESLMKQASGRADKRRVTGVVRSVRTAPGVSLEIDDQGGTSGRFVITSISMKGDLQGDSERFVSFTSSFVASGAGSFPLPDAPAKRRAQTGLSYAIVVAKGGDEVYPEAAGRVRSQLHWDREGALDDTSGTWLRVAQRLAPGSMMFPRTGWVLATLGLRGEADAPLALGRIFDGEHRPAYELPANKTRVVYKTATTPGGGSYNEIHFEDKLGAEVMHVHASKDTEVLTRSIKTEMVHNDAEHKVDGQQSLTLKKTMINQIELTQRTKVGRDELVVVDGDINKNVARNETISIGGSRTVRGKSSHSTTIKHDRKLKVGAALIDISLGQITREAKNALTMVGGLMLRVSGESIGRQVGALWAETVGGVKYVRSGHSVNESIAGDSTEMIGGSMVLQAGTTISEDASESADWTVLGKLTGTSKETIVEAHDLIQITCGASSLTLDPRGISMSSTVIELEGKELELLTAVIEHN